MPTVCPSDGSYFWPELKTYAAMVALTVGDDSGTVARASMEVVGEEEFPTYMGLTTGDPVRGATLAAATVGSPADGAALTALTVEGISGRTSRLSLTVNPLAHTYRSLMMLDIVRVGVTSGRAVMGLNVFGRSHSRIRPTSVDIQGRESRASQMSLDAALAGISYPARMALDAVKVFDPVVARMALDVQNIEGFTVIADIIGADIAGTRDINPAGYYPPQTITARLWVNNEEIEIRSFDYQKPAGKLGAILNVTLAEPIRTLAPTGSDIVFELLLTDLEDVTHAIPLVAEGKIGGRSYTISMTGQSPGDELTISALDVLTDKFSLRPTAPVIMFDPDRVPMTDVQSSPRDAVLTHPGGRPILPILEPVANLSMMTALRRAYTGAGGSTFMTRLTPGNLTRLGRVLPLIGGTSNTTVGLGFSNVITNIHNYPVRRVDFGIESGWHDAVAPLVGMFGAIYFVQATTLFIIDAERALPAGFLARTVPIDDYSRLSLERPYRDPFNAVILSYQEDGSATGLVWRPWVKQPTPTTNGTFGEANYQRIETYERGREAYFEDDPDNIVLSITDEYESRTFASFPTALGQPGNLVETAREVQQDRYDAQGLKVGHTKTTHGLVTTGPDRSGLLQLLTEEVCDIVWIQHPYDPSQQVQEWSHTYTEGLIYESESITSRLNPGSGASEDVSNRYPVTQAQSSPGIIRDSGAMIRGPIRMVTRRLRNTGGNQLDVLETERDLINGTVRDNITTPTTGTRSTNKFEARARHVLLRDLVSEAEIGPRIPQSVVAGELPKDMALDLGYRVLAHGVNPPERVTMDIIGYDPALDKGSVVRGEYRDGELTPAVMVEGLTVRGANLGQAGKHFIGMSLDGVELI